MLSFTHQPQLQPARPILPWASPKGIRLFLRIFEMSISFLFPTTKLLRSYTKYLHQCRYNAASNSQTYPRGVSNMIPYATEHSQPAIPALHPSLFSTITDVSKHKQPLAACSPAVLNTITNTAEYTRPDLRACLQPAKSSRYLRISTTPLHYNRHHCNK